MNNRGWGLGIMLICLAAVGICLLASAILVHKLERTTGNNIVASKTSVQTQYNINVSKNK